MLDALIEKFQEGLAGAILEMVVGLIPPIVLSAVFNSGVFLSNFIWVFYLISGVVSIIGILELIKEMSLWGISYIIGWLVGLGLLVDSGLLTPIDIVMYFIPPLFFLVFKILKWIGKFYKI